MSDDLATLLRDASNEPTMTPDADAIHAAGQRRTVVRRTATGLGALALMGVVAIGVNSLTERAVIPPIDTAPPTEAPAEEAAPGVGMPTLTAAALAERTGGTVSVLQFDAFADPRRYDRADVAPDGEVTSSSFDVVVTVGEPLVTDNGRAWVLDGDNRTVTQAPGGPLEVRAMTDGPSGWLPIGVAHDDQVLVTEISTGGVPVEGPPVVRLLGAEPDALVAIPGIDTFMVDPEGAIVAAAFAPEQLVLMHMRREDGAVIDFLTAGESSGVRLHAARSELSNIGPMALTGERVWIVEHGFATDGSGDPTGPVDILIGSLGDDVVTRVATPLGRSVPGMVSGIDASPDGATVVLSVRGADGEQQPAIVVDVAAAGAAARERTDPTSGPSADDVVAQGVFSRLDVPGIAAVSRWDGPAEVVVASTCATEGVDRIDARPLDGELSVWFICDGASAIAGDSSFGFWRLPAAAPGAPPTDPADQVIAAVERWAAGPSDDEQELGLSGGIGPDITLSGVSFEGSRVLVDLTPAAGAEAAWSTSAQSIHQSMGFAAAALQLPEFDELQFTTGGRCEDFTLMTEVVPCWVYTEAEAPWAGTEAGALPASLDGRHLAHVRNVDVDGDAVEIDLVQWITGPAADVAYREDRLGEGEFAFNDYWTRDRDTYRLLLNVADGVSVRFSRTPEGEPGSFGELPERISEVFDEDGNAVGPLFWVQILDGRIDSIEENWVP